MRLTSVRPSVQKLSAFEIKNIYLHAYSRNLVDFLSQNLQKSPQKMHVSTVPHLPFHKHFAQYNIWAVWVWFSPHLSLVLLSNVSLSSTNPGPKKGTDNFLIGEQTSNLDQGMGVFVCGLQPTRIALWASIGRPSSQARVTSVNSSSSLMSPETRARRRGLSSSMGQGMFLTHFVVFDQTSSLDHNNITKLWPLDGSFGQSSVPFFGTQNCWGERDD